MILTTNLLENSMKWSKLYSLNLATTNSPSSGQVLSYSSANDGTFSWINAGGGSIPDNSIELSKIYF